MTIELNLQTSIETSTDPLKSYVSIAKEFGTSRAFILESLGGPDEDNRFSMTGLAGRVTVSVQRGRVSVSGEKELVKYFTKRIEESGLVDSYPAGMYLVSDDAYWQLPRTLGDSLSFTVHDGELASSFLAFFGYDSARYIEKLPRLIEDPEDGVPDVIYSLVDVLITHYEDSTKVAVVNSSAWKSLPMSRITSLLAKNIDISDSHAPNIPSPIAIKDDITKDEYLEKGRKCLEHIRVGDIYQVQLGHSVTIQSSASPLDVYRRLRWRNPSPYMALMHFAGVTVICSSPELFLRTSQNSAVMRPIAGTAPRGGDEDRVRIDLLEDAKEQSEHLMLVDLCRNDLSRIASPGSVATTTFMAIEEYSHVFHIVSQVKCKLKESADVYDIIRATFPAGTMSGAPKVRAMEIIESLETSRRGFYSGAFGLIGLNGKDSVLGLAIRMAVHKREKFTIRASAGFVADSTPEGEWQETLNKLASTYWAVSGEEIR